MADAPTNHLSDSEEVNNRILLADIREISGFMENDRISHRIWVVLGASTLLTMDFFCWFLSSPTQSCEQIKDSNWRIYLILRLLLLYAILNVLYYLIKVILNWISYVLIGRLYEKWRVDSTATVSSVDDSEPEQPNSNNSEDQLSSHREICGLIRNERIRQEICWALSETTFITMNFFCWFLSSPTLSSKQIEDSNWCIYSIMIVFIYANVRILMKGSTADVSSDEDFESEQSNPNDSEGELSSHTPKRVSPSAEMIAKGVADPGFEPGVNAGFDLESMLDLSLKSMLESSPAPSRHLLIR